MKTKKIVVIVVAIFGGLLTIQAQKTISYTAYKEALHVINPAQVGVTGKKEIMAFVRMNSINVDKSPKQQILSYAMPFEKNIAAGISVVNYSYHINRETDIYVDASYKLQLNRNDELYFGLKLGGTSLSIDRQSLGISGDATLSTNVSRPFSFNAGAGLYFKADKYFIGLAVPNILPLKRYNTDEDLVGEQKGQLYFNGGYKIDLKKNNMAITPTLMLRHDFGLSTVVDLGANFEMMNKFELGLNTRFSESFGAFAMFKFLDYYKVGYAFESIITELGGSSHNILFRVSF